MKRFWLGVECVALFFGVPAAHAAGLLPVNVIALLLLMTAACWGALNRWHHVRLRELWQKPVPPIEWRRITVIYAVAIPLLSALLSALLWLAKPAAMFSLIRLHPGIWLLVMFAYPLVSVVPQEIIYRAFFFVRYRALFGYGNAMMAASATVFGFGHVVFHNWPSVILTCIGGWLFAKTYQRTGSLRLVAAEHMLYGWAVFTIGYGQFFFDGTLKLFR